MYIQTRQWAALLFGWKHQNETKNAYLRRVCHNNTMRKQTAWFVRSQLHFLTRLKGNPDREFEAQKDIIFTQCSLVQFSPKQPPTTNGTSQWNGLATVHNIYGIIIFISHFSPCSHQHRNRNHVSSPRCWGAYFSPRPRKCCPIRRTMSWSVRDKALVAVDLLPFSMISPLVAVGHSPFCCDVVASSLSPLCCGQPLACMLPAEMRCFLCGGGETPPSSEPEDDASIALRHSYGLY